MTRDTAGRGRRRKSHVTILLLAVGDSDVLFTIRERNIFYIIGVIIIIVIVLKVLHVF
jgi:hypothetical protein